jgi:hypothetical protein
MSWLTRKRIPSEVVSGGNTRIQMGAFGVGTGPLPGIAQVDPMAAASIYNYHEGDLFAPGAQNWVFEPNFELPLQTIWGFGFIRNPNTFNPIQPPQVYARANVQANGVGGLQAGELQLQGLINPEGESAPFTGDFAAQ